MSRVYLPSVRAVAATGLLQGLEVRWQRTMRAAAGNPDLALRGQPNRDAHFLAMPVVAAAINMLGTIGPEYSARATDDSGGQFSPLISPDLRRAVRMNTRLFDRTRQMGVETLDDPDWAATATAIMLDLRGERQVTADVLIQEGFDVFSAMPCHGCDVVELGGQFRILAGF